MTVKDNPMSGDTEAVALFKCETVKKGCDHQWIPEDGNPEYCAKCGTYLMAYAMMECF